MQTDSERSKRKLQETSHHSRRQKLNQWRDQLQVDRLLGLIYDFFWISGDNEAILDLRDLSKVQLKNDSVQAFDTKWDEVLSANHWQTYRQHIGESVPDVIWKVGRNEILVASQRSREDSRRQEIWLLQIEINAQRHLEQKRKDSHFKARNRDEERLAIGAPRRGKAKGTGKEHAEKNAERGACIRWITKGPCSFGEACAFKARPEQERQREGTTSFTFSDKFTAPKFERWRKR